MKTCLYRVIREFGRLLSYRYWVGVVFVLSMKHKQQIIWIKWFLKILNYSNRLIYFCLVSIIFSLKEIIMWIIWYIWVKNNLFCNILSNNLIIDFKNLNVNAYSEINIWLIIIYIIICNLFSQLIWPIIKITNDVPWTYFISNTLVDKKRSSHCLQKCVYI